MRIKTILLGTCLVIFSVITSIRFCTWQMGGFELYKIASNPSFDPRWEVAPLASHEQERLNAVLEQPFYFLGKGGQCYAFINQDSGTVLKLFKQHHMRVLEKIEGVPLPKFFDNYRKKMLEEKKHRTRQFLFNSCTIAHEMFKTSTGLLYLHLNKTEHLKKKLTLIDRLGIAHQIDLDATQFVLQKKAERVYAKFKQLKAENNLEAAKTCLDSLLTLLLNQAKLGIKNRDLNLRSNFGFVGMQAIEIDLGSYTIDETLKLPSHYKAALEQNTRQLKRWIKKRYPELDAYFEQRLQFLVS